MNPTPPEISGVFCAMTGNAAGRTPISRAIDASKRLDVCTRDFRECHMATPYRPSDSRVSVSRLLFVSGMSLRASLAVKRTGVSVPQSRPKHADRAKEMYLTPRQNHDNPLTHV